MSTRRLLAALVLLASAAGAQAAATADVEGTLTLRYGDPMSGAQEERLQASIEAADGRVYAIDAALAAADGVALYDLSGHEVVARLDGRQKSAAGLLRIAALSSKAEAAAEPVADSRPWMNLLCKFADKSSEPTTRARIDAAFAPDGEITRFWQATSQGFIDLGNSRSLGWVTMAQPYANYMNNGNPNLQKVLNDCVAAAGQQLADAVQAEDFAGINVLVNESLGCCAWGGNARATIGGNTRTWRVTWVPPSAYANISLFAHELGHAFGMPHSNNSDGDSNTYDNPWDLLSDSNGHAVTRSGWGTLPKTPSGYHLDRAGWLDASEKRVVEGADEHVVLQRLDQPAEGAVRVIKIRPPQATDGRYWIVEARVRGGEYDGNLPDDGVLVYEVDPRRAQPAWLVDASDPAANYSNTRSVVFKSGDRWNAPDGSFSLKVTGAGANAFAVDVDLIADASFESGFE